MRHAAGLQLLAVLLLAGPAAAPLAGQSTVAGVVIDAATRRPIADVLVRLDTTRQVTAADGKFRFTMVLSGSRRLRVSHIAYAQRVDTLVVENGAHIDLLIPIAGAAIQLEPLSVEVRSRRLVDVGFYDRATRGLGIHVTREQLQDSKATRLGDFLARVPGVRRAMTVGDLSRIDIRGSRCEAQVFLNGSPVSAGTMILDNLVPDNIEGIEIYRGASEIPIEFDSGGSLCGAIVIWTRRT